MELEKKEVSMLEKKGDVDHSFLFDEDYNVPDVKPDIRRIIQKKGKIQICDISVREGNVFMRGILSFQLLYVADLPGRDIYSLEGELSFDENVAMEGIQRGDQVSVEGHIENWAIHLVNSRKLNLKGSIEAHLVAEEVKKWELPVSLKSQKQISCKKRSTRLLCLGVHKKDTLRRKEEITLPSNQSNIETVLWSDLKVRGMNLRAEKGKIIVKGEMFVFLLYKGDDENHPLQWLEQSIPFSGSVACEESTGTMVPSIKTTLLQANMEIKPDEDGEERVIQAEVVLELDIKLYEEKTEDILLDVYSPQKEYVTTRNGIKLEQLLVKNQAKCKVNQRIFIREAQEKILQVCHSEGSVLISDISTVKDGIRVEGVLLLGVLYSISDDEMPFYSVEKECPFCHVIEAKEIKKEDTYHLQVELEQLSTMMLDSSEIEVKAILNFDVMVLRQWTEEVITQVEEKERDMEILEQMPGIICYVVQPKDTLWDIAKRFCTTVESIRELNQLEKEVQPKQTLLIVKKALE